MTTPRHRPTIPGAVLSVAAGTLAVAFLIEGPAQWRSLALVLAGLGLAAVARGARTRDRGVGAVLLAVAGALLVSAGIATGATQPDLFVDRLELLPGLVGLTVLVAGLLPVRAGRERALVTAGAALLFVGVVTSGVVRGASAPAVLVAGVATVLAWDLGHQSASLGRQLDRRARTYRATFVHAGGTALAGTVVAIATLGVSGLNVGGLSLTSFAVLLAAGFLLVLSLRH